MTISESAKPFRLHVFVAVVFALTFISNSVHADDGDDWLRTLELSVDSEGLGIATHATGVYAVGRARYSYGIVRRYDFSGNLLWSRRIDVPVEDYDYEYAEPFGVTADDSGVYIAGRNYGALALRLDHAGQVVWSADLTEFGVDPILGLGVVSAGEIWGIASYSDQVYVAGNGALFSGTPSFEEVAVLARLDASTGAVVWVRVVGREFPHPWGHTGQSGSASGVAVDATGVYVSGTLGDADARRYDHNGNLIASYGPGDLFGGTKEGLVLDESGIYVAGTPCPDACQFAVSLKKYSRDGRLLWRHDLPSEFELLSDLSIDPSGVYVAGPAYTPASYIRKYSPEGDYLWTREFGPDEGHIGVEGISVREEAIYLTGWFSRLDGECCTSMFVSRISAHGGPRRYVSLATVDDLNGNGTPELAVVSAPTDGQAEVDIRDSATKQAVSSLSFDESSLALVDLGTVRDISGEGYPELVALFAKPDGPAVVQVKDAATGHGISRLRYFGKDWDVTAVSGIDRGRGGPDIAVLAGREDQRGGGIQIRFAEDEGTVDGKQFPLDSADEYRDLTVLKDVTGDGQPELATLFARSDGTGKVVIRDGITKDQVDWYLFPGPGLGTATAIGVTGLADVSDDGAADVAVLFRKASGQGVVQLRDAGTGRWLHQMQFFGSDWYVVAVTSLDSNGDGVPDLAVLGVRDDGTAVAVQVRDASTGQALNWIDFSGSAVN